MCLWHITDHFGQSLSSSSSRQKAEHDLRYTQNCLLTLGGYSVLTGDGKLYTNT